MEINHAGKGYLSTDGLGNGKLTSSCRSGLDTLHSIDDIETVSVQVLDQPESEVVDEPPDGTTKQVAPDGGWGWMVVVGCTLMHFLLGGITRSYGVFYVHFERKFEGSAAVNAWIGGTNTALRMGCSPLATSLASKFGTRKVAICGGLMMAIGLMLSAAAPTMEFLFFSYSALVGVGASLTYVPAIVLVGQYFDKHRALAIGLSTAGSGLGVFCMPPIIELLFHSYGYFGTCLICGAVALNQVVSGSLYRPLPNALKDTIRTPPKSKENITEIQSGLPEAETNIECNKIVNSNGAAMYDVGKNSKRKNRTQTICANIQKHLDLRLFKDTRFLLIAIPLGFAAMSYSSFQMLLHAFAKSRGMSPMQGVMLISVLGVSDLLGRIISGVLFDLRFIQRYRAYMYFLALLLSGIVWLFISLLRTYATLLIVTVVHGCLSGTVVSQRAVIIADLLGVNKLSSSLGLAVFIQGIGVFIGPLVAGALKDMTGNYDASYYFGTAGTTTGAALLFLNLLHTDYYCSTKQPNRTP